MSPFAPESLARWSGGCWTAAPSAALTGFAIDTRQLRAGDVFVALRTEKRDGHDFVAAAAAGGAGAALVARPVPDVNLAQLVVADPLRAFQSIAREHRRHFSGKVIGVTGSAGKTSTKNVLSLLLGSEALATEGNLNNHLGVPLTLTRLDPTRHAYAVIEAGISEPGEMMALAEMIEPDAAIVTLIAAAHTDALEGLEGVAREKSALARAVRPSGLVVLPASVAAYAPFQQLRGPVVIAQRVTELAPLAVPPGTVQYSLRHDGEATELALRAGPDALPPFRLPRVSDGMAQNVVLALVTARHLGVDSATLAARLARWTPAPLRGEVRRQAGQLVYLDCYNANPASMLDALEAFRGIAGAAGPRWYVLGGMEELGPRSPELHREVGQALQLRPEDRASVIGPAAEELRRGALAAGAKPEQVEVVLELAPLAEKLRSFRGAVFVKGSRKYRLEEVVPGAGAGAGPH